MLAERLKKIKDKILANRLKTPINILVLGKYFIKK